MDKAGPHRDLPKHDETTDRVAERRPEGVSVPTFAEIAMRLVDNGYEPVPILPHAKKVAARNWTTVTIDEAQVEDWIKRFGHCGIGLRTGKLVAVDIDLLDPDLAHDAAEITRLHLGDTLLRVGRWPKRLLLYRTRSPEPKRAVGKVEILGLGQQFVAFGIHPDTGQPYDWPLGESPLDVPLDALPLVDAGAIETLLAPLQPIAGPAPSGSRVPRGGDNTQSGPIRAADGRVIDGRDQWLSLIAYHGVYDAVDRGETLDAHQIAAAVWQRFLASTDLDRPKQDGRHRYGPDDALKKVRDKLRLLGLGQLPERQRPRIEPSYVLPTLPVDRARVELDHVFDAAMTEIANWHRGGRVDEAPCLGVRATVGLGKSTAARRHVVKLLATLAEEGQPARLLNFVPSLALADETAAAWQSLGVEAQVLRGYEALQLTTRAPMCRDVPSVRAAVAAGLDIQSSVCFRSEKEKCAHYAGCAKQSNRREVAKVQVVVAAYDAMYTGFAGDAEELALVLVDEACWSRSLEETTGLTIEALPLLGITGLGGARKQDARGADMADAVICRQRLSAALASLPLGQVRAADLAALHIDGRFCEDASRLEVAALARCGLVPGQSAGARRAALATSVRRALGLQIIALWDALAALLRGDPAALAKVWLDGPAAQSGQRPIRMWRRKAMAPDLISLPLLHLDATLRPEIAKAVLPRLEIVTIEAAAPHQHVRLIGGGFGMGSLCPAPQADAAEINRRANRLRDCLDYVRWHAKRHAPQRCLVITYKAIEAAFADIPGVEVAHYNAVAGLDCWGDIGCLFLIGRPLPSSVELHELTGAVLDHSAHGKYQTSAVGILTETGRKLSGQAIRHTDPAAEILRAAICDDEVMQAMGRGRGINRTDATPLEVHLMAHVVLPLAYDRVMAWEMVCPDIVQRMLLCGMAVDSPADAAMLHPGLFSGQEQAKKAFQRGAFKGHFPIRGTYREMSLKSAAYRRSGRGRGWQRAWWVNGSADERRAQVEAALGALAEWVSDIPE
ncbi:bifunctional DNA primase/polymerase [Cypionkella psychrotolerans]|uniref:bifunctional DNA primase/polymerase n=1 Tax=Cypionkella psychrotolerans TaxID=1678131 RepID=UPI0006B553A1|nr:bifunctional DNA primase/polymerase [Cypionkella psychrotolerans]